MTREEYNNLTDEQRYSYILELEEEKKVSEKALEKVLSYYEKDDDPFISLTEVHDGARYSTDIMIRISDIIKAEENIQRRTIITTKEISGGYNKQYTVKDSLNGIMKRIAYLKNESRNDIE